MWRSNAALDLTRRTSQTPSVYINIDVSCPYCQQTLGFKHMALVESILSALRHWLRELVETLAIYVHLIIFYASKSKQRLFRRGLSDKKHVRQIPPEQKKCETLIESIERRTLQRVTIETSLTNESLEKCHPQSESPLFRLPKELRDMIFEYGSTQSPDPNHMYQEDEFYYRPGHTARHKTYTSLLFTCRRAWLEANAMPMQQAEHSFWFHRGPYDTQGDSGWSTNLHHERDRYARFLRSLTPANLQNLTYIHLFMQMFQAQEFSQTGRLALFFSDYYLRSGLRPKVFHITIRQSDWWEWEQDHPLLLDESWVQSILDSPKLAGIEVFRLELETFASKVDQLNSIVGQLQALVGVSLPVDSTNKTSVDEEKSVCAAPPETWQWTRGLYLSGKTWPLFKDAKEIKLHVAVLTWRKEPSKSVADTMRAQLVRRPVPTVSFPLQFHATLHSPSMVMQLRSRRALMHEIRWNVRERFSHYAIILRSHSNEQATKLEDVRRDRFDRMFGNMEACKLMQGWNAKGSLLRFEGWSNTIRK